MVKNGANALVAPSLFRVLRDNGHAGEFRLLRSAGVGTYSVDYVYETITDEAKVYQVIDKTFYTSEDQRQLHWKYLRAELVKLGVDDAEMRARSAVVGSTMTDQLAIVDRSAVRRRLGLGASQPVIVLMSLKMGVPDPWRRLVWGRGWRGVRAARALFSGHPAWVSDILLGHGYRNLVEALRSLSRRTGAALVAKSRVKNRDPGFVGRFADVFLYDEAMYPYTSIELMAVADLCVHFQSGAVLEAAFAGVPSTSVQVSQTHLKDYVSFDEVYGGRDGSLQNFPGVVWPLAGSEAPVRFGTATLEDFALDPEARRRYIEKFLGFDDTKASVRVLEAIERAG